MPTPERARRSGSVAETLEVRSERYEPPPYRPRRTLGDHLERLAPQLRATPARAAAATLATLLAVVCVAALQPVTATGVDTTGAFRARCGVSIYLFGHPSAGVEATCRSAYAGHAVALFAAVGGMLAALVVLAFLLARPSGEQGAGDDERTGWRALVATPGRASAATALVVFVVLALGSLLPARAFGDSPRGAFSAQCGVSVFVFGHSDPAVTHACRDAYGARGRTFVAATLAALVTGAVLAASLRNERRRRRAALIAAGVLLVALMAAPAAIADPGFPPERQGWWTATASPVPVPPLVPIGGTPSGAPDVAPGDLYVAGSANSAQAVSALRYVAPDGVTIESLTLKATPGSVTIPGTTLRACPLTGDGAFAPAEGGPINDAPVWNCDRAVVGEPDAAGGSYRFAVGSLVGNGVLAIAIVPAGTADRVVLAPPDAAAVAVTGSAAPVDDLGEDALAPADLPNFDVAPLPAATSPLLDLAPAPLPPGGARTPGATPTAPAASRAPEVAAAPLAASLTGHTGAPSAVGGAALVIALAMVLWWRGRRALGALHSGY
jgi:hypothetical protein